MTKPPPCILFPVTTQSCALCVLFTPSGSRLLGQINRAWRRKHLLCVGLLFAVSALSLSLLPLACNFPWWDSYKNDNQKAVLLFLCMDFSLLPYLVSILAFSPTSSFYFLPPPFPAIIDFFFKRTQLDKEIKDMVPSLRELPVHWGFREMNM